MADIFTKKQRSVLMSKIRASGNKTTEVRLAGIFRKSGVVGWRRNNRKLPGKPDFVFGKEKTAIFVDGCFWHGCRKCLSLPKSRKSFWLQKIENNRKRDKRINRELAGLGWNVFRIREHELKSKDYLIPNRILSVII